MQGLASVIGSAQALGAACGIIMIPLIILAIVISQLDRIQEWIEGWLSLNQSLWKLRWLVKPFVVLLCVAFLLVLVVRVFSKW